MATGQAGPAAHLVPSGEESAGRAISAISYEPNATDRALVHTVSVSLAWPMISSREEDFGANSSIQSSASDVNIFVSAKREGRPRERIWRKLLPPPPPVARSRPQDNLQRDAHPPSRETEMFRLAIQLPTILQNFIDRQSRDR